MKIYNRRFCFFCGAPPVSAISSASFFFHFTQQSQLLTNPSISALYDRKDPQKNGVVKINISEWVRCALSCWAIRHHFRNLIKILNPSHPWEKISSRGKTWHSFVAVVFLCEIYLYIKPWEMFQIWYISLYKILENVLTCEIYLIRTRITPIWSFVFHLVAKMFDYDLNEAEDIGKR